jgi:hypothetical protein
MEEVKINKEYTKAEKRHDFIKLLEKELKSYWGVDDEVIIKFFTESGELVDSYVKQMSKKIKSSAASIMFNDHIKKLKGKNENNKKIDRIN